jgi:PAS domain S-box-containing protein
MFIAWGPQHCMLYNDAYLDILGEKHPRSLGRPLPEVWPEIWDEIKPLVEKTLVGQGQRFENVPFRIRRNGTDEQTWFTFLYSPIRDRDGRIGGMYCALTETTAQVLEEERRQQETARLYTLFEQAPGFMAVLSGPTHVYELANVAYLRFVGRRDLVGKPVKEVFPELAGQGYLDALDQVYTTGKPFLGMKESVLLQRQPSGPLEQRFVDFIFQPMFAPSGIVSGIFIEGYDVTDHARIENHFRESEAKFRTIANAMPQMVWSTLPDGSHDYFNQQWYDFTGLQEGSTDGPQAWNSLLHPEDRQHAWQLWRHSLETGEPYSAEYRLRHHSGEYRWVLGRAVPVRGDKGHIVRWMGTSTDMHEQKLAQEALEESDRRKDEFLAMLAHELRNPLAPIAAAADLLPIAGTDAARVRQLSDIIARHANHMTSLINDLLDVSRVTRGLITLDQESIDIKTLLTEAIEQIRPLIEARSHRLETHFAAERVVILGDRKRLVQVVANLLSNAAKFTPTGGHIVLRMDTSEERVTIAVRDNGIGMPPDLLARAFELFAQGERTPDRSQGGLGIGLALVESLVHLHGGTITAHSNGPGAGSEFMVSLPRLRQETPAHSGINTTRAAFSGTGAIRVLIVDDNADAAQLLAMFLQAFGYETFVEYQAVNALDCAQRMLPKVCLLDIGLPGMDGNALARQLRTLPGMEDAALAAITGYGRPQDKEVALAAGFNQHFVKPLDTQKLLAWLGEVTMRVE